MKLSGCRFLLSQPTQPQKQTRNLAHLIETQRAHGRVIKLGRCDVQSEILGSYCESKAFDNARQVFDETSDWDVVLATTIVGRFAKQNRHEDAIYIFSRMLFFNIRPNEFTFGTVIHSSTCLKDLNLGKQLHASATKVGLQSDVFVGSAALDLYIKLSTIEEALNVFVDTHNPNVVSYTTLICGYLNKERFVDAAAIFREMPQRNVITWNAMICGHSQTGHSEEAVNLFIEMLREGLVPTEYTFPCVLSAAANIAALGMGRSLHACALKFLGKFNSFVGNALVSFYSKCGSMDDSILVFNTLSQRSIVSWNAMVCGYAHNGRGKESIDFFHRMQVEGGFRPNGVTLLGLLLACSHSGLVSEGYSLFHMIRLENSSLLNAEHYACMVDLLARSGNFEEAVRFLRDLPFDPGIGFWKAMLGGCQIHTNNELGEFVARKILDLNPIDVSSYVMLSNAHSAAGRWKSVSTIRREMKERGIKRVPGCSWIEIRGKVHTFTTGDKTHGQMNEIFMVLRLSIELLGCFDRDLDYDLL